jgi:fatty acid desaturase
MSLNEIQDEIRSSVEKTELQQLMEINPARAYRDLAIDWAVILCTIAACGYLQTWWSYLIGFVVIGCCQYALFILGHDALHGSLHPNRKVNDLMSRWLIHGAMFMGFEDGKRNHLEHHKLLGMSNDPDRYLHVLSNKHSQSAFLLFCSGMATFGKTVLKVTPFGKMMQAGPEKPPVSASLQKYIVERVPVMVMQPLLLAYFYVTNVPLWMYPLLWIAPIYFCVFLPDEIRAFCEHAVLRQTDEEGDDFRLITFVPPLVERLYFSPHNMNYHAEHHLWTRIPYYNLPKAHELVKDNSHITLRRSYLHFLSEVIQFLKAPVAQKG